MSVRSLLRIRTDLGKIRTHICSFSKVCPIYSPGNNGVCIHKGDDLCKDFIRALMTSEF